MTKKRQDNEGMEWNGKERKEKRTDFSLKTSREKKRKYKKRKIKGKNQKTRQHKVQKCGNWIERKQS